MWRGGRRGTPVADIAAALQPEGGPGSRFGHRDHLRLGWAVLTTYGPADGEEAVCTLVAIAARTNGFADRYHETVTRFWCRQMAPRLGAPEEAFDDFYDRNPALWDQGLVRRHYSPELLATPAAAAGWVDPDLEPLPGSTC